MHGRRAWIESREFAFEDAPLTINLKRLLALVCTQ